MELQGDLLKKFNENNYSKVSFLKSLTKGKPPWIFSSAENLQKMDACSDNFQKFFLAKKLYDCNQIRSNQIDVSLNALKYSLIQ